MMRLQNQILEEIKLEGVQASVLVKDLNTNELLADINSAHQVVSASIIKNIILLCALEEIKHNQLSLDMLVFVSKKQIFEDSAVFENGPQHYSIQELLNWMIVSSDNTATNVLIDLLSIEKINRYSSDIGLTSTRLERKMLDYKAIELGLNNYTTAFDQLKLFELLYSEKILTPALCKLAIHIFSHQRDKSCALRYLWEVRAAHKTGQLTNQRHDTGLFFLEYNTRFFGLFLQQSDAKKAERLLGRLGKIIYEA